VPEGLKESAAQNYLEPSPGAACCLALTIVLSLGLRMLVSILLHPLRIGWDPALHLMCASLICQGKLPYVDMFDVNPPLIWYINTLPASLAALSNTPLPLAFNLFLLCIMVSSGLMSAYVIVNKLNKKDLFVNLGVVFGLLLFNFFLTVDFGQREEIFVLLFMPYFFFRMARWQRCRITGREAILFGLVGAAGIFMKHYFVLNFLAVELFFFMSARVSTLRDRIKPLLALENLTMAAFGAVYAGHFFLLPAAVRHNYFDFLLPAFARGYFFWDTTVPNCMTAPGKRNVFLFFTACGAPALSLIKSYPVVGPIISFSLASLVVYLLQFKGWAYQDIPVLAGGFMLGGAILGVLVTGIVACLKAKKKASSTVAYVVSVLVTAICLVSAVDEVAQVSVLPRFDLSLLGYSGSTPMLDIDTPFKDIILANSHTKDPIVFVSNAVAPGYPITMQLHRTPASRHLHVCILSVLQYIRSSNLTDAQATRLLSYEPKVVEELGQDILSSKAPLVFLQDQPVKSDYLAPYHFIDKYLSHYKVIDDLYGFSVYKLETREPASGALVTPVTPATPATPVTPTTSATPAKGVGNGQ